MGKFTDSFQKINFKQGKYILPLIIFLPIIFIGYMFYGVFTFSVDDAEKEKQEDRHEIADVPLSDSLAILSKADALSAQGKQEDFTAIQFNSEQTIIKADTTIYTEAELAELARLEEEWKASEASIHQTNENIQKRNRELSENRRSLSSGEISYNDAYQDDMNKTLMLYQKMLNGEEILTPEQERERELARARQEERQRVVEEMNSNETVKIEKATKANQSSVFNTIGTNKEENSYIRAMVDQGVTVVEGSRISLRLLDNINIKGQIIPAGTIIYGIVRSFGEQRVLTSVSSIITAGRRVKVDLSVYDRDGIEGFFIPKSSFRDLTKDASAQALNGGNLTVETPSQNLAGMAVQALQGAYQSVTGAISKKIKENKAKIKYNTTIYLINNNE